MFGIGFSELIVIAIVALVLIGPKRLPEVMQQAGKLFVHLRRTANEVKSGFDQVVRDAEDEIRREEAERIHNQYKNVTPASEQKSLPHSDSPVGSVALGSDTNEQPPKPT